MSQKLSRRAARLCALLRVRPQGAEISEEQRSALSAAAAWLDQALRPGQIALIAGPSRSGKSRLLDVCGVELGGARWVKPFRSDRRVVDTIPGRDSVAIAWLVRLGLSDPAVWLTPTRLLCETDQARLALARAFARCAPGGVVLVDDLGAALPAAEAAAICRSARRAAQKSGARLIAATGRDDLLEALAPECLVVGPLSNGPQLLMRESGNAGGRGGRGGSEDGNLEGGA